MNNTRIFNMEERQPRFCEQCCKTLHSGPCTIEPNRPKPLGNSIFGLLVGLGMFTVMIVACTSNNDNDATVTQPKNIQAVPSAATGQPDDPNEVTEETENGPVKRIGFKTLPAVGSDVWIESPTTDFLSLDDLKLYQQEPNSTAFFIEALHQGRVVTVMYDGFVHSWQDLATGKVISVVRFKGVAKSNDQINVSPIGEMAAVEIRLTSANCTDDVYKNQHRNDNPPARHYDCAGLKVWIEEPIFADGTIGNGMRRANGSFLSMDDVAKGAKPLLMYDPAHPPASDDRAAPETTKGP